MKTIKVNLLKENSIDRAIAELQKYTERLTKRAEKVANELTKIGAKVVDDRYKMSHEPTESYAVTYYTYKDKEYPTCVIIARGENVMFLEFGTGIYTDDFSDEFDHDTLPPIFGGSWSQTEGMGHFRPDHQYWYYNGIKYQGTLPMMGFYFATKEMQQQAETIVREAFK